VEENYLKVPEAGELLGSIEEEIIMTQLTLSDTG